MEEIDTAWRQTPADADKYMPEKVAFVHSEVRNLRTSFERQDYATVVEGAPAVLIEARTLAITAAEKRRQAVAARATE
jgi:hypothetical protein